MKKYSIAIALATCLLPVISRAGVLNLATLTCIKYQNEVLNSSSSNQAPDSINTVMWLFGYAVGKSGAHVMYGDALSKFGFALDSECKDNPTESLLNAISVVKPDSKNPMDLSTLQCATFESRHKDLVGSDRDSATTIMMWLFGFSVAKSGSHMFDADSMAYFEPALQAECTKHPESSLFDALAAVKISKPASVKPPTAKG